ncbi:Sugar transporter domain containing protein [Rhypophila sp. PSN 637]
MAEPTEPKSTGIEPVDVPLTEKNPSRVEKGHNHADAIPDLNENLEAKIKNPLAGLPRETLFSNVTEFCNANSLAAESDLHLFKKAALIAQDPASYETLSGEYALDETEKEVLRNEVLHKWRVPKALYMTIITCSIGAAVQGWDQTGSNGANLSFPKALGIGGDSQRDTYLVGLVNAAPYIGSAFIGCWLSDPVNYYFGRRGAIFFSAHFCLWPVIGSAFSRTWEQLLVNRLLMGIGMGAKASSGNYVLMPPFHTNLVLTDWLTLKLHVVPIFAAENSPAAIRGALVMSWQLWTAFGILAGTVANVAVAKTGDISWRLQLGSAFIPAVPLLILIYFCPESPRWYMKKGRYQEAYKSLLKLRNHPLQAARDLYYIQAQLEIEKAIMRQSTYAKRFVELFTIPRVRRATLAAFTVMIAQQMCGINIIAFYSTTIFRDSGIDEFNSLLASFGFGLVNFLFAFPALYTIDTFGRRSLLLFTFPNMAWSLLAAGLCTLIPGTGQGRLAAVALFVYIFGAFYSPGEGPVPYAYSAEVFPLSHREVGMAFSVATCLFFAAVLSITLPAILASLHVIGVFCLYAGFNMLALVMIFFWVPETKQRTLEELDYIFAVPTRVFGRYQLREALPYFVRRWVLWDRKVELRPLYQMDIVASDRLEAERGEDSESASVERGEKEKAVAVEKEGVKTGGIGTVTGSS